MQYPQIGSILSNGYKVLANYKNKVVLAQHPNKEVPEPFAVWHLSPAGDTWGGHYSSDPETAEKWFARLCFDWLDEGTAPEADVQERRQDETRPMKISLEYTENRDTIRKAMAQVRNIRRKS